MALLAILRIAPARFAVLAVLAPAAAQAADNTRYVSVTGSNANACTLAAPCRTLQRGINMTPAGGEVQILDSGFYGNANVRKSLTISGNGNTVYLANSVLIDQADAVVALRGLVLNGQGTVSDGIRINAAATVHIERCLIHAFDSHGILAFADGVQVFVTDSISRDNGSHGLIIDNAGVSRLSINSSRFENNGGTGVSVGTGRAVINRSVASGNSNSGISAFGGSVTVLSTVAAGNFSGFSVNNGGAMTLEFSRAHGNSVGLFVSAGESARISNSSFTDNVTGINNDGTLETRENNTVAGNTTNVSGTLTPIGGV
jgi:hypothetical protein